MLQTTTPRASKAPLPRRERSPASSAGSTTGPCLTGAGAGADAAGAVTGAPCSAGAGSTNGVRLRIRKPRERQGETRAGAGSTTREPMQPPTMRKHFLRA